MDTLQPPAQTAQRAPGACPTNGQIGRRVDSLTLKAVLAIPLDELRPMEYRFCRGADCPTVYYSVDGTQTFTEADLRERVYQKHPDSPGVFVCYCFRHTVGDISADIVRTRGTAIPAAIARNIQRAQCACDIRNPQGDCCLGNVRSIIRGVRRGRA